MSSSPKPLLHARPMQPTRTSVHLAAAIFSPWRLPNAKQITVDQLLAIVRTTPASVLGSLANATIVTVALWGSVPSRHLLIWYVCCVVLTSHVGFRWIR